MKFLLSRYLRVRSQKRYWRRYARSLEKQLEAEVWRNREREDSLVSTYVRAMGMYAPAERASPAPPRTPLRHQPHRVAQDSFSVLSESELAEWDIWKEDAIQHGVPIPEAKTQFLAQLKFRKSEMM